MTAASPEGLDLARLAAYLEQHSTHLDGPLSAEFISGGRSNLTYRVTVGQQRWVLRRPPLGQVMAGTHDVAREFRMMQALQDSVVPVPRTVLLDAAGAALGVPFYLMDEVAGTVLRTPALVDELDVATRGRVGTALVETLADLHGVDYAAVGLADLGRPDGYLARQLARWVRQYETIKVRELPHVEQVVQALHAALPVSTQSSIVHGDYRLDNVIVQPERLAPVAAVLDWELATLGDPLVDLGTLVMFWDQVGQPVNPITAGLTARDGFATKDEVVEIYTRRRGMEPVELDWYVIFSQFKLAIILEQIHARHSTGQTVGDGFSDVGAMVLELLESARNGISTATMLAGRGVA